MAHIRRPQLLGWLRWNHLSPAVQDQPGQHSETLSHQQQQWQLDRVASRIQYHLWGYTSIMLAVTAAPCLVGTGLCDLQYNLQDSWLWLHCFAVLYSFRFSYFIEAWYPFYGNTFFLALLEFELRVSCLLSRCCTIWATFLSRSPTFI
jgi:hypothetical protein